MGREKKQGREIEGRRRKTKEFEREQLTSGGSGGLVSGTTVQGGGVVGGDGVYQYQVEPTDLTDLEDLRVPGILLFIRRTQ